MKTVRFYMTPSLFCKARKVNNEFWRWYTTVTVVSKPNYQGISRKSFGSNALTLWGLKREIRRECQDMITNIMRVDYGSDED